MYSGGPSSATFTGYYDNAEQEYVYPDARQNAVIVFSDFYLSALDNDFTTDGLSIMSSTGSSEDITVGNAVSAVCTASMLNPSGLMEGLTWGDGAVYIGAQTASAAADTYASLPCHVYVNSIHYGINSSGNARRGSTTYTLGGNPIAVIANSTGTDVLFVTDTKIGRYNGSFSVVNSPTAAQSFLAAKYQDAVNPVGVALDANGCPTVINDVTANTKVTYSYVPMGIFDFSNVDAYGSTFQAEAYDKMTVFDADATDWINNLSFTGGKTIPQIIDALIATKFGMGYVIDANAVNTAAIVWNANPVTSYSVTYRQIICWLAEAIACNARMGRDGRVEFYVFDPTSVGTVTPDTIVNGSRTKNRNQVPAITQVICYNALGAAYTSTGSAGSNYYIVGNPFVDPSADLAPINNIRSAVDDIPTYYVTSISVACYDPHIDIGDFITVDNRDSGDYLVPIMSQTIHWAGMCNGQVASSGNQVRQIPTALEGTDLSSVVDSNPSAVVNKIQAVGISADWITTGRLTVLDNNNNVLFDADKDNNTVSVGGLSVGKDYIGQMQTPGSNDDWFAMRADAGFLVNTTAATAYDGNPGYSMLSGGHLHLSKDVGGNNYGAYVDADEINYTENGAMTALRGGSIEMQDNSQNLCDISSTNIILSDNDNLFNTLTDAKEEITNYSTDQRTTVKANSVEVMDLSAPANTTTMYYNGVVSTDGTNTSTLLPTMLKMNDSNRETTMNLYSIHHNSGTAETSYTRTIPTGLYIIVHGQHVAPNANAQGLQVLVIGTNNGSTPLITTLSGSGSDLTATTGTRSQITMGNSDGSQATLTWTVQGRGYRRLEMIRLN